MPRGCRAECFHVSLNGCNFRCLLLEYFEVLPGQSAEGRRKKGRERENVFGMRTRALSLSSFRGVCVCGLYSNTKMARTYDFYCFYEKSCTSYHWNSLIWEKAVPL